MPGPLAMMFSGIKQGNDADFAQFRRDNPQWGTSDYDRALFNTRLSRLSDAFKGGRMPDDDGGTIYLDEDKPIRPIDPNYIRMLDGPSAPPTPAWRDASMQAGPEPPVDPRILARLFGNK